MSIDKYLKDAADKGGTVLPPEVLEAISKNPDEIAKLQPQQIADMLRTHDKVPPTAHAAINLHAQRHFKDADKDAVLSALFAHPAINPRHLMEGLASENTSGYAIKGVRDTHLPQLRDKMPYLPAHVKDKLLNHIGADGQRKLLNLHDANSLGDERSWYDRSFLLKNKSSENKMLNWHPDVLREALKHGIEASRSIDKETMEPALAALVGHPNQDRDEAFTAGLGHPAMMGALAGRQDLESGHIDKLLNHMDGSTAIPWWHKNEILSNLAGHAAIKPEHFDRIIGHSKRPDATDANEMAAPQIAQALVGNNNIDFNQRLGLIKKQPDILSSLDSRALSANHLHGLFNMPKQKGNDKLQEALRNIVVSHKNFGPQHLAGAIKHGLLEEALSRIDLPYQPEHYAMAMRTDNPDHRAIAWDAAEKKKMNSPSKLFSRTVNVAHDTNKLRLLRDYIDQNHGGTVHKRHLPNTLYNDSAMKHLTDNKGQLDSRKIQEHIEAQPKQKYHVSHSVWNSVQRHDESRPSKVFQLNVTDDHIAEMKKQGVYDHFKKLQTEIAKVHPINPHTIGWTRWTGNPEKGIMIDEIQSDWERNQKDTQLGNGRQHYADQGNSPESAEAQAQELSRRAEIMFPSHEHQKIKNIIFGGKDSQAVIHEAFHQYQRDMGRHGTHIAIHSPHTKAPMILHPDKLGSWGQMSQIKTDAAGKPVFTKPVHTKINYSDQPKKMGYQPAKYGDLKTQASDRLPLAYPGIDSSGDVHSSFQIKGMPTWQTKITKKRLDIFLETLRKHHQFKFTPPKSLTKFEILGKSMTKVTIIDDDLLKSDMPYAEFIRQIKANGWYEDKQRSGRGDHINWKHPTVPVNLSFKHEHKHTVPSWWVDEYGRQTGMERDNTGHLRPCQKPTKYGDFVSAYMESGHLPDSRERFRTWHPEGKAVDPQHKGQITHLPIDSVIGPEMNESDWNLHPPMAKLRQTIDTHPSSTNKPGYGALNLDDMPKANLPPVMVDQPMDLGDGKPLHDVLGNDHSYKMARALGLTHVPAVVRKP